MSWIQILKAYKICLCFLLNYNDQSIGKRIFDEQDKICFVANYTKESTSHLSVAKLTLLAYQGERETARACGQISFIPAHPFSGTCNCIFDVNMAHDHSLDTHRNRNFALPGGYQDNVFLVVNFIRKKYHKFHTEEKRMIHSLSYKEKY